MNKAQYQNEVDSLKAPDALKNRIQQQANREKAPARRWIPAAACAAVLVLIAVPAMAALRPMGKSADVADMPYENAAGDCEACVEAKEIPNDSLYAGNPVMQEKTLDEIAGYYDMDLAVTGLPDSLRLVPGCYAFTYQDDDIVEDSVVLCFAGSGAEVKVYLSKISGSLAPHAEENCVKTAGGFLLCTFADKSGCEAYRADISRDGATRIVTLQGVSLQEADNILNAFL